MADISTWSIAQVADWVRSLGSAYAKYVAVFEEQGIDGDMLVELDDELLTDLQVTSKLHRKRFLKALARLKAPVDAEEAGAATPTRVASPVKGEVHQGEEGEQGDVPPEQLVRAVTPVDAAKAVPVSAQPQELPPTTRSSSRGQVLPPPEMLEAQAAAPPAVESKAEPEQPVQEAQNEARDEEADVPGPPPQPELDTPADETTTQVDDEEVTAPVDDDSSSDEEQDVADVPLPLKPEQLAIETRPREDTPATLPAAAASPTPYSPVLAPIADQEKPAAPASVHPAFNPRLPARDKRRRTGSQIGLELSSDEEEELPAPPAIAEEANPAADEASIEAQPEPEAPVEAEPVEAEQEPEAPLEEQSEPQAPLEEQSEPQAPLEEQPEPEPEAKTKRAPPPIPANVEHGRPTHTQEFGSSPLVRRGSAPPTSIDNQLLLFNKKQELQGDARRQSTITDTTPSANKRIADRPKPPGATSRKRAPSAAFQARLAGLAASGLVLQPGAPMVRPQSNASRTSSRSSTHTENATSPAPQAPETPASPAENTPAEPTPAEKRPAGIPHGATRVDPAALMSAAGALKKVSSQESLEEQPGAPLSPTGTGTGPRPPSQGPKPPSQGPKPPSQGPKPPSQGPKPPSQGPKPPSQGPKPPSQGPRPPSQGPRPPNSTKGPRPPSQGPRPPNTKGPRPPSSGPHPPAQSGPHPPAQSGPHPPAQSGPHPPSFPPTDAVPGPPPGPPPDLDVEDKDGTQLAELDTSNLKTNVDFNANPKTGWLYKRGNKMLNKGWKKRFFVLKGNELWWLMNEQAKYARGKLNLSNSGVYVRDSEDGDLCVVELYTKKKVYILRADSAGEMEAWKQAFRVVQLRAVREGMDCSRPLNAERDQTEIKRLTNLVQIGAEFSKFRHKRAKLRRIWMPATLDRVVWGHTEADKVKGFILVADIEKIEDGCEGSKNPERAFTVVTPQRTLELEASDDRQKTEWIRILNFLVQHYKSRTPLNL